MSAPRPAPAGRRVLVVSGYDVRRPRAGDAERYLHEITRRWVAGGVAVTWVCPGAPGVPAEETVDGVRVHRGGLSGTVARLVRRGVGFDAVLDATGRLADPLPLGGGRSAPVIEVLHRAPRRPAGRWGRFLADRRGRVDRARVALSPSARHDLRRRHRLQGPIFVVPPGAPTPIRAVGERAVVPTVVVDADLVAGERIELLLGALPAVVDALPGLRVEILGGGPELGRLRRLAAHDRLAGTVTLHGRVTDADRDGWWRRAWVTVCTADGGSGARLLTAAGYGVPGVVLAAPGVLDFVRAGRTGYVVDSPDQLAATLTGHLTELGDDEVAGRFAAACRAWAGRFSWERSAALLAGVVEHQIRVAGSDLARRRSARPDIATLVRVPGGGSVPAGALRPTDEVATVDGQLSVLLNGCDEVDAFAVLTRLGVTGAELRLAGHDDLLVGPHPLPPALAGAPHHRPLAFDRS
ncbi:glycosyltransferase family 4 protein [Micromonospora sp. WMMD882]|uniref:glycosyltransferase family 4 protein n=1 Tax=Micromonospora sp. WMMD882 TaxID=3015151 RepID=UPI00248B337F|nr:glycosyltransferase family 4 protein [Micromonospora sp. WMMD882]WBB79869.1 glycosyltransferase family 4 protein [Micromonospora sp. WMMD882]